jgi:hypothetical protein
MRYAVGGLLFYIAGALHATPILTVSSPTTNVVLNASDFAALRSTDSKIRMTKKHINSSVFPLQHFTQSHSASSGNHRDAGVWQC